MGSLMRTVRLVYFALWPGGGGGSAPEENFERGLGDGEVLRLEPGRIRGGVGRLVNSRGELRLFFPGCLAMAAPALLFRLKREGFSRCTVQASKEGLLVQGMR